VARRAPWACLSSVAPGVAANRTRNHKNQVAWGDMRLSKILVSAFVVIGVGELGAQGTPGPSDSVAIMAAMENWERAWMEKNAILAAQDYSDDADWTNAFGMRRIGRDNIEALLVDVFALDFVMAGDTEYEYHDLRFLRAGAALLRSKAVRVGQQLPDGTVEPPRQTNHLRVFEKRDARWVIISHLIGDARTPGQPR
jgi:uncharacterized protein (TIGR02246 family)